MVDKLIVISGKQFSGKDTVGKLLLEHFETFRRTGIADAIKLEYGKRKNLSLEEIESNKPLYRQDLIELGDWGRAQDPDYWLKSIIATEGDVIVTDVRVEHELNLFRAHKAFAVRVEASQIARAQRGRLVSTLDNTETALDHIANWDYVIENNGTYDELKEKIPQLFMAIEDYFKRI